MDYKALLKKYMQHVWELEGVTFVDSVELYSKHVEFTDEEIKVLRSIDKGLWE